MTTMFIGWIIAAAFGFTLGVAGITFKSPYFWILLALFIAYGAIR